MSIMLSAAETALIRTPLVRVMAMAAEGNRMAKRLARLVKDIPRVLNAVLLAALLSQIAAATVTGILADRWYGALGISVASAILTVILFIYAEAIPKTYTVHHPDRVALALAYPVAWLEWLLRPIVTVLVWVADIQMPGKGVTTSPTVTEDELRMLASRAAREGQITDHDLELIERAFRVGDRRVDDIMVPRPDIVAVADDVSVRAALEIALESGHRRLPVFKGSLENITGVVGLRDLVQVPEPRRQLAVGHLTEEPLVVPESKRVLDLLQEMQATGIHLAVVVDEYGGTAGLVTVEDIAEEVLGTLSEETGNQDVVATTEGRWMIEGSVPVEDLEALIGAQLPEGDWNTTAGLVLGLLGRLPEVGDEVDIPGHRLRVTGVRQRRITRLALDRLKR